MQPAGLRINGNLNGSLTDGKQIMTQDELFEKFWLFYPRKIGKGAARKAFQKLHRDQDEVEDWIAALDAQKRWRKAASKMTQQQLQQFQIHIPAWKYPSTWISNECWTDELPSLTQPDYMVEQASASSGQCDKCNRILGAREHAPGGLCCWCYSVTHCTEGGTWNMTKMKQYMLENGFGKHKGESVEDWGLRCRAMISEMGRKMPDKHLIGYVHGRFK